jgi:putative flavoprotein involved in K+ transport
MNARFSLPAARRVTTVIIGAGQAGLAASHYLSQRGIDHVVLERGEVANSWRSERWDSLRLLTPNWQTVLPQGHYSGPDPDGFMSMPELVAFLSHYASDRAAPVVSNTRVTRVSPSWEGFRVATNRGSWHCRSLVLASGAFNLPQVPALDKTIPKGITRLTPHNYRNPGQLAPGGVLVVGAAATGLQIAEEIQRAGHQVTLAAGEHVRLPRCYRGRDIQYWMHRTGLLDQSWREVDDLKRARSLPSFQLVGSPEKRDLDINSLRRQGVQVVGRLAGISGTTAQFSGALGNAAKLADLKMGRLLDSVDQWLDEREVAAPEAERPQPTGLETPPRLTMELGSGEIRTIIWATGFRPDYSWLKLPVLDRRGFVRHQGGVAEYPGLYLLGLPFMRRRKSSFIFGAADDARDITAHLAGFLANGDRRPWAVDWNPSGLVPG